MRIHIKRVFIICWISCILFLLYHHIPITTIKGLPTNDFKTISNERFSVYTNKSHIFYNKVGKTGSRFISKILKKIAEANKSYHFINEPWLPEFFKSELEARQFVENFQTYPEPYVVAGHSYYIDFRSYNLSQPVYLNLIRDPIDRAVSSYYYYINGDVRNSRSALKLSEVPSILKNLTFEDCVLNKMHSFCSDNLITQSKYFCGHKQICRYSSKEALFEAKRNVQNDYLVVGIFENISLFFEVLERLMPYYFHGAPALYLEMEMKLSNHFKTVNKKILSETARSKLKDLFVYEYEFYEFVKQKIYNQIS